jgi:hypothetical protein
MSENRYFVCYSYKPEPARIDLQGPADGIPEYHRDVLRVFERELRGAGLTVYLTWLLDTLPSYGRDVVPVVMGDEWSRTPLYAQDVLATFKVYGTAPPLGFRLLSRPSWIRALLTVKYVRAHAHGARGRIRRVAAALRRRVPPIVPIPLGYGNQADLPVTPLAQRGTDVFFAGSVAHGRPARMSAAYWLRNPKTLAREAMLESLERLKEARPELIVRTSTTPSFTLNAIYYGTEDGAEALGADAYSSAMMDSKICLVPRGTSAETFRYFEALRYGCIAITEPQPDFPFYRGAPVVEIQDWRRLDEVVADLLASPDRMQRLHHDGMKWWRERCAPEPIGRMMARVVDEARAQNSRASGHSRA